MDNLFALILAGGRVDELSVLTLSRPKSALPFGGMYRVIDFPLSNLMHSGVEKVGILSQYQSLSLINHVGLGAWWDLVGRDRGLTLLMPSTAHDASEWYRGTSDAVYQNLDFVKEQNPDTILILSGDHIYKMDYRRMLYYHLEKDADLTIAFAPIDPSESTRFGVAALDDEDNNFGGRVLEYREKPAQGNFSWASLTIYLFKPSVLYSVLEANSGNIQSHEFGRDIIPAMIGEYNVYGYKFRGYWGYTRTIDEYWQTNMDLLREKPSIDLNNCEIRTNLDHDCLRDRSPAQIGKNAVIDNSFIQNGCIIDGQVKNSILFPGVHVEEGAIVKDSILFYDGKVRQNAVLDKVIADFEVEIGPNAVIGTGGNATANVTNPDLLKSGITLLGKGITVPPHTEIGRNCILYPGLTEQSFVEKRIQSGNTVQ